MDTIYYLFSNSKKKEALFLCKGSNFIDSPYLTSDVYPMGIILSMAMKVIMPALNDISGLSSPDDLLKGLAVFSKEDSTFSRVACKDENLKMILNVLLGNKELYNTSDGLKEINTLIGINKYLSECSKEKNKDSSEIYYDELSKLELKLPSYIIYNGNNDKNKSKEFSPQFSGRIKPLFGTTLKAPISEQFGKLILPVYVYEINLISDLLTAAIQQVFKNDYTITKCKFCDNFFVAKDKRKKHCPTSGLKSETDTCYTIANRQRAKCPIDDEIKRTYNSVRNMLLRKCNNDQYGENENTQRFEDFKEKNKWYQNAIKLGRATPKEYLEWLRSFYVHKYKK